MTQQHVADKAGLSRLTVSNAEKGRVDTRQSTIEKILRVLSAPSTEQRILSQSFPPALHNAAIKRRARYEDACQVQLLQLCPPGERTEEEWSHLLQSMKAFPNLYRAMAAD